MPYPKKETVENFYPGSGLALREHTAKLLQEWTACDLDTLLKDASLYSLTTNKPFVKGSQVTDEERQTFFDELERGNVLFKKELTENAQPRQLMYSQSAGLILTKGLNGETIKVLREEAEAEKKAEKAAEADKTAQKKPEQEPSEPEQPAKTEKPVDDDWQTLWPMTTLKTLVGSELFLMNKKKTELQRIDTNGITDPLELGVALADYCKESGITSKSEQKLYLVAKKDREVTVHGIQSDNDRLNVVQSNSAEDENQFLSILQKTDVERKNINFGDIIDHILTAIVNAFDGLFGSDPINSSLTEKRNHNKQIDDTLKAYRDLVNKDEARMEPYQMQRPDPERVTALQKEWDRKDAEPEKGAEGPEEDIMDVLKRISDETAAQNRENAANELKQKQAEEARKELADKARAEMLPYLLPTALGAEHFKAEPRVANAHARSAIEGNRYMDLLALTNENGTPNGKYPDFAEKIVSAAAESDDARRALIAMGKRAELKELYNKVLAGPSAKMDAIIEKAVSKELKARKTQDSQEMTSLTENERLALAHERVREARTAAFAELGKPDLSDEQLKNAIATIISTHPVTERSKETAQKMIDQQAALDKTSADTAAFAYAVKTEEHIRLTLKVADDPEKLHTSQQMILNDDGFKLMCAPWQKKDKDGNTVVTSNLKEFAKELLRDNAISSETDRTIALYNSESRFIARAVALKAQHELQNAPNTVGMNLENSINKDTEKTLET